MPNASDARQVSNQERIGSIRTSSGDVIIIDYGLISTWSGGRAPESDRPLRDARIVGPDARRAADRIDFFAVFGRYVFDVADFDHVQDRLATLSRDEGLQARVEEVDRMPHLVRSRRLLDDDPAGAIVPFGGGWAVAGRGLPADRELAVLGLRMPRGSQDEQRWHSVWVEVSPAPVAGSEEIGHVLVDQARLLFADPDALSHWTMDPPHAAGELLDRRCDASPHGAAVIEIGDRPVTGLRTSWGDGAFPVFRDYAADGSTVAIRAELGGAETVARMRRMEELWTGEFAKLAMVSARVIDARQPVRWLYREVDLAAPTDSGWRVFAGNETDDEINDPDQVRLVPLRELITVQPDLEPMLRSEAEVAFELPDGGSWQRIDGYRPDS